MLSIISVFVCKTVKRCYFRYESRNIVYSATAKGIAAQNPPERERSALKKAVLFKSAKCILRAGRIILAARSALKL